MTQAEIESLEQIDDMVWEVVPNWLITLGASMVVVVPLVGIISFFAYVLS